MLLHFRSPHGIIIMQLSLPCVNISSILHQLMRELLTIYGGLFDQIWSNGSMVSWPSGVTYLTKLRSMSFLFDWSILIVNDFIFFFLHYGKKEFYNWGSSLIFELQWLFAIHCIYTFMSAIGWVLLDKLHELQKNATHHIYNHILMQLIIN
jgi:hypothetical protein